MILAVSHPEDAHAAPVMEAVARMGWRCALLDLATVPRQVQLSFSAGRTVNGASFTGVDGARLDAAEIAAVWWRRPRPYVRGRGALPAVRRLRHGAGPRGALRRLGLAPGRLDERPLAGRAGRPQAGAAGGGRGGRADGAAHAHQLRAGRRARLPRGAGRAPGDPEAAPAPPRPAGGPPAWSPKRDRSRLDDLRLAPAILQAYVPGTDIRVTAAGGRLFATAIDARDTSSPHDFRPAYAQARVEPCELPADVAAGSPGAAASRSACATPPSTSAGPTRASTSSWRPTRPASGSSSRTGPASPSPGRSPRRWSRRPSRRAAARPTRRPACRVVAGARRHA